MSEIKFIDLFCGIGGVRIGMEKALENSQTSISDNDETVSPEKFKTIVCDALKILQNPKVKEEIKSVILRSFISKIVYHKFISNIEIFYFY